MRIQYLTTVAGMIVAVALAAPVDANHGLVATYNAVGACNGTVEGEWLGGSGSSQTWYFQYAYADCNGYVGAGACTAVGSIEGGFACGSFAVSGMSGIAGGVTLTFHGESVGGTGVVV